MTTLNNEAEDARIRSGPHKVVNDNAIALTLDEIAEHNARVLAWETDAPVRALADLREQRNARLTASDWTQLPDAPTANAAAWKVYRQALRDLPQRTVYPNAPQWPTAP